MTELSHIDVIFVLADDIANYFGRSYSHNCGRCYCHCMWMMKTTFCLFELLADAIAMVVDGMTT